MSGWTTHTGQAVCLPIDNVDTDQLIPARFMSQSRADGYARFLLHDLRHGGDGTATPDFVLNRFPQASVLVSGCNFGTGSSREAAVYALLDAGIQVIVASGFSDIFAANAVNNGLLPAQVEATDLALLQKLVGDESVPIVADLTTSTLTINTHTVAFSLDDTWRLKLINGWDDIDLTLGQSDQIDVFRAHHYGQYLWALPINAQDSSS